MPSSINNLPLPRFLDELLASLRWKRPTDTTALAQLTGVEGARYFELFSLESMRSNTQALLERFEKSAAIFGLTSSARGRADAASPALLDVDRAILIAATFEEEFIALDYRDSLERPSVRVTDYSARP